MKSFAWPSLANYMNSLQNDQSVRVWSSTYWIGSKLRPEVEEHSTGHGVY